MMRFVIRVFTAREKAGEKRRDKADTRLPLLDWKPTIVCRLTVTWKLLHTHIYLDVNPIYLTLPSKNSQYLFTCKKIGNMNLLRYTVTLQQRYPHTKQETYRTQSNEYKLPIVCNAYSMLEGIVSKSLQFRTFCFQYKRFYWSPISSGNDVCWSVYRCMHVSTKNF